MNNRKEDEVYCPECGKAIKKEAVICLYCKTQVKDFKIAKSSINMIDSSDALVLVSKGIALNEQGKYKEAIKCCDEAIRIEPGNAAAAWYEKGIALNELTDQYGMSQYEEVIKCCNESIRIDPGNANAWLNKGSALYSLGKYEEAIKCYDEAIKIEPGNVEVWEFKCNILRFLDKYEEAIKCCDEAIRIEPGNASALAIKGDALNKLGKYEEAIKCCDESVRIDPSDTSALIRKGDALNKLGKYEEAIKCCDESVRIDPSDTSALAIKGAALRKWKPIRVSFYLIELAIYTSLGVMSGVLMALTTGVMKNFLFALGSCLALYILYQVTLILMIQQGKDIPRIKYVIVVLIVTAGAFLIILIPGDLIRRLAIKFYKSEGAFETVFRTIYRS